MTVPKRFELFVFDRDGTLIDSGDGVRFEVERGGETSPAFAIRYDGRVRACLNRCAHMPMELDWKPGKFFDAGGCFWYARPTARCTRPARADA